jgi:HD domain
MVPNEVDNAAADRFERQIRFVLEIDRLKTIVRRTYLLHADRAENTAEHSWHLAMMAILLSEYANEPVDVARVVKMVLIHDIVEIEAGDTIFMMPPLNSTRPNVNAQPRIVSSAYFHPTKVKSFVSYGTNSKPRRHRRRGSRLHWTGSCLNCTTITREADLGSSMVLLPIECSSVMRAWQKVRTSFGNALARWWTTRWQKVFSPARKKNEVLCVRHAML